MTKIKNYDTTHLMNILEKGKEHMMSFSILMPLFFILCITHAAEYNGNSGHIPRNHSNNFSIQNPYYKRFKTFKHTLGIHSLAVNQDYLVLSDEDNRVYATQSNNIDRPFPELHLLFESHSSITKTIVHDTYVVTNSGALRMRKTDIATGALECINLDDDKDYIETYQAGTHNTIYIGTSSGKIKIWDTRTSKIATSINNIHSSDIKQIVPYNKTIISQEDNSNRVQQWDLGTGKLISTLHNLTSATDIVACPTHDQVACIDINQNLCLYDVFFFKAKTPIIMSNKNVHLSKSVLHKNLLFVIAQYTQKKTAPYKILLFNALHGMHIDSLSTNSKATVLCTVDDTVYIGEKDGTISLWHPHSNS